MNKLLLGTAALAMMVFTNAAKADMQTVTLKLDNFYCVSCAYIIQKTLAEIPGVAESKVSYARKTALVTYNDAKTKVADFTAATAELGFPARPYQ